LGISDLPGHMQAAMTQKLIVSHEVCHALQDQKIDILARARETLGDIDREYAVRSAIEGMATVVMLAYSQGLPIEKAPDARATMRGGFNQNQEDPGMRALAAAPVYLRESLISPYAEGGAFAQAWLRSNPGLKIGVMLDRMPTTSEQVLHFDRYIGPDDPTPLDLSPVSPAVPTGWTLFYANGLGEFDLRVLFGLHEETREAADRAAAGWDGLRYQAYTDSQDRLLLVAASAWDSETDAGEFAAALRAALGAARGTRDVTVAQTGARVYFALGPVPGEVRTRLVEHLSAVRPSN
jgi:hypothetical protein